MNLQSLPDVRYTKSDGLDIAYAVMGEGPLDIVLNAAYVSHLELTLEAHQWWPRLSRFGRLIMFDKRGTGLSDRACEIGTLEERIDDVRAVMDAAKSERATLIGISEGGAMSVLFAATHPERVSRLVLWASFARSRWAPDYPYGVPDAEIAMSIEHHRQTWGTGLIARVMLGESAPPEVVAEVARHERMSASPNAAARLAEIAWDIDVRNVCGAVQQPALVVHRVGDPVCALGRARDLAARLPSAELVELPGDFHVAVPGDGHSDDDALDVIERFLTGREVEREPDRVLATVMFTDIVGSTAQLIEVGDEAWKVVLDRFDALTEAEVRAARGTVVKSTGDGTLATFDGPARAVRCADALVRQVGRLGVDVRVGLHTGEIEHRHGDVAGVAVHIAARVASAASPGEILVSRTVRDLVAGSGLVFADRGEHELKGVPERWQVYALTGQ